GATPTDRKVRLPYSMASLDKITTEKALSRWLLDNSGPYVIADKLDGVSAMHVFSAREEQLYTRGNGLVGSNISPMLGAVKSIGRGVRGYKAVRGELVISNSVFGRTYSKQYRNPRNFVSGVVNATRETKAGVSDLAFFVHSVIDPVVNLSAAKSKLEAAGYSVVPFVKKTRLTETWLLEYLAERRKKTKYDIDGLVITANSGAAVAFKAGYEMATAIVKEVEWSITRFGYLKPVVILQQGVKLAGVTVKRVSAHNAKFVMDNRLGPGARIDVVRSGEVIPKIASVEKGASRAQMPKGYEYTWTDTGVDIIIDDHADVDEVVVGKLTEFLIRIGVDRVKQAQVAKLVDHGIDTIPKLLKSKTRDFEDAGMGGILAAHLYTKMNLRIKAIDLPALMAASGVFPRGMGERRFETLLSEVPYRAQITVYKGKRAKLRNRLSEIPGIGQVVAADYVAALPDFIKLVTAIKWKPARVAIKKTRVSGLGLNPIVVFTGFRDRELQDKLKAVGGKLGASVSANTTHVVSLNPSGSSLK
ncbi:hypothetical protein KDA23_07530, partial [Candidatus Saccharibacteria bacterium]|nr:hypothetical protein [Candidatus Saccharibacteria bacterium]